MITKNIFDKTGMASILFAAINSLFIAKYSERLIGNYYMPLTAFFFLVELIGCQYILSFVYNRFRKWYIGGIAVACIGLLGMVGVQYLIDPYSIKVDRWSALHFPIQHLLEGIYPYCAQTHLGGYASPFPIWQLIHVPFYLLGNVGLSFFAAVALFIYSICHTQGYRAAVLCLLLIITSPAIWYEVAVRSDLIGNSFMIAAVINFCIPYYNSAWLKKYWYIIACALGLLACTRLVVLIPAGLLLLPEFVKMKLSKQIAFCMIFLIIFILTFLPFALWDWEQFFYHRHNPWSLQTRQGNLSDFIIFVPLGIYLAFQHCGNISKYFRNVAIMFVTFIGVSFLHNMYSKGNWDLFSASYDITYFSLALPFIFACLSSSTSAMISRYESTRV